ncbi:putative peroxisomal dehydratase [Protomyces lactucae-debilis]|uniref:Putative peroxisomal dehydratase n=1 Tax=Protomyces lactucae-debilis TaxID=2754530 RepID=A0A1Y2F2U6_PROLT|nr:putative peroxisomal dehydratase [Protomyces lactucae-debilis]ORY77804.1 putative peroxisomal dehydratase [Protomyces lactucae-debilis]
MSQNVDFAKAVGHKFEPVPQTWTKRDVLLFANSIGVKHDELHLLYELHPDFAPFPTYPVLLPFRHADDKGEVTDFIARNKSGKSAPGAPKLDPARIVDGERYIEVLKPLPASSEGHDFVCETKLLGLYDKGKAGLVTEVETLLIDRKTGEAYTKIVASSFAIGQGGYSDQPKQVQKTRVNKPPKEKANSPDKTDETKTTLEQALLYRLNADYNPLHADPKVGKTMGFPGVILHGLCSWNIAAVHVLRAYGQSQPGALVSFEARFAAPVLPGQTLRTEMWLAKDSNGIKEVVFHVKCKDTGKVVLSNGRAQIKSSPKSKI